MVTAAQQKTIEDMARFIQSTYSQEDIDKAVAELYEPPWINSYTNTETGRVYTPHHKDEHRAVYTDVPLHLALKGGEGSGKSVAGIVKTLERLRRQMHGLMISPDLPHFKRSLWPEFRRWCPWEQVVPEHQYRSKFSWEPRSPFVLAFKNGATLMCGGIDDPGSWEGPNVSFAHFDEARRKKTAAALKVLTGRVRIPGPKGEPPQIYFTTTPRKHWLHEYFGPLRLKCDSCAHRYEHYANTEAGVTYINLSPDVTPVCPRCESKNYLPDDPHTAFKLNSMVLTLLTKENEINLQEGFTENRALSLTSAEARVLLDAEWEDIEAIDRFLPNMLLWELCKTELPSLGPREPLVLAMDAATGRTNTYSDCFGMIGVTRYPPHSDTVAVRLVQKWQAKPGRKIDFQGTETAPGPERVLRTLAQSYNLVVVAYDRHQLHDMATRLSRERIAWMHEFSQAARRIEADTDLLNLITHRRVLHDGNRDLYDHLDNADCKTDTMDRKLRIVKREEAAKVDLAICLSMAAAECLRLSL